MMKKEAGIRAGTWIAQKGVVTKKEPKEYLANQGVSASPDLPPAIKELLDLGACFEQRDGVFVPMGKGFAIDRRK